ncbi:hypothetical protein P171DRAFT_432758 [Karstenula rhodostoma CBS 690.94]|uniref:Uncharacterized protein n=1 Tax=Karstenula rhodostoma CBS 690.94 TaxID=1392251 RepID=A0A9P4PII3_9PLEO|nr:hypothetical protein P171DRAFT_432758 [Karstenula rhodostoma CBS 690.94]
MVIRLFPGLSAPAEQLEWLPPNRNWALAEPIDFAGTYGLVGAVVSGLALRLFRRARPGAFAFRLGASSMLVGGFYAVPIVDYRVTREILLEKGEKLSASPIKLWECKKELTADDGAVLGGIGLLALSIKFKRRTVGMLPTWQRYVGYAGVTTAGAAIGGSIAANLCFSRFKSSCSLKAQKDLCKAEQNRIDDMKRLAESPVFLEKLGRVFMGIPHFWAMLSQDLEERRMGTSEASLATPFPNMSPVSWLPQPIYPVLVYVGNDEPRIDWTLAARSNPQSSGNTVDTMTREAEYVAFQINERIQTLNLAPPGLISPQNPLLSSVMTLIRLERCILEDIEEEKSHHGESFDVSAFLSSLNIEAKHNRDYDPQASVSCLRRSLGNLDKGFESAVAKGSNSAELSNHRTGLKGLINDLERQSYAVQNLQYGGIEGPREAQSH